MVDIFNEYNFQFNNETAQDEITKSPVTLSELNFNDDTPKQISKHCKYGTNYPVVYIINNDEEAYVGETNDATTRTKQHLQNPERRRLDLISIIGDKTFNTSAILDLESFLIKYMAADNKFILQNGNGGLKSLNYYNKDKYEQKFEKIWETVLLKHELADNHLRDIKNSDLFKYSPYKSLTSDQYSIAYDILRQLEKDINTNDKSCFVIEGGPGTGKTVLAIYLLKLIRDHLKICENEDEECLHFNIDRELKVGIVVSMENLKCTLKKVFSHIAGLGSSVVFSPNDIVEEKEKFDILIVDEAHRLRQRKNLSNGAVYRKFSENNAKLGLPSDATELDWIKTMSSHQIYMYDSGQSIKPTDINKHVFDFVLNLDEKHRFKLETQLRCLKGGAAYITYLNQILSNSQGISPILFENYEFKLFDNVNDMVELIRDKDKEFGLCRTVAGYSWKFKSKNDSQAYDIIIQGNKYRWNSKITDWVNSKSSRDEIGSIHTIQGFDLNYCGVIIGNELKYDPIERKIYVDRSEYQDKMGKDSISKDPDGEFVLYNYVKNIYMVLLTRGILGTYVYVCDPNLRDLLSKYIEKY